MFNKGDILRSENNINLCGVYTGKVVKSGSSEYYEVEIGVGKTTHINSEGAFRVEANEKYYSLLTQGLFGDHDLFKRSYLKNKVAGNHAGLLYSMNQFKTDFMPHQFKPVYKFINSPTKRLLIADEVGLGKTIEAIYIWEELVTRLQARRLLIICPSVLMEKWRSDIKKYFDITLEVIKGQNNNSASEQLLTHINSALKETQQKFYLVCSLESLRAKRTNIINDNETKSKQKLYSFLTDNEEMQVFDLVIFDEAHYLRNSGTANNFLAKCIRDKAKHLLLLSATPIQVHSQDLFQLLNLLAPEEFDSLESFNKLIEYNREIQELITEVSSKKVTNEILGKVKENSFFKNDKLINSLTADDINKASKEENDRLSYSLEQRKLFNDYISRTRKVEAIENRVKRRAQTYTFNFSDEELKVYRDVSNKIRSFYRKQEGKLANFTLIIRQQQMASSLYAGLKGLINNNSLTKDSLDEEEQQNFITYTSREFRDSISDLSDHLRGFESELKKLKENDTKYNELRFQLLKLLERNPKEKIIIFAFFRNTISYLEERFEEDEIRYNTFCGGMNDMKESIFNEFKREDGPNILLCTQVASEGLDLQFCNILINYDLPWNPMKVEQRIGRIDRIGQKADAISILNFINNSTLESKILQRLYNRIGVFKNSIGDLEAIIGESIETIVSDVFNPGLTENEKNERAENNLKTIELNRLRQEELEESAVKELGLGSFISYNLNKESLLSNSISKVDLYNIILQFFKDNYPGVSLKVADTSISIKLTELALKDYQKYRSNTNITGTSRINCNTDTVLFFDDKKPIENEILNINHPVIQWIIYTYRKSSLAGCITSVSEISTQNTILEKGVYFYFQADLLTEDDSFKENLNIVINLNSDEQFNVNMGNILLNDTYEYGRNWDDFDVYIGPDDVFNKIIETLNVVHKIYLTKQQDFKSRIDDKNTLFTEFQLLETKEKYDRRIRRLIEQLSEYKERGLQQQIPMTEGLIKKLENDRDIKISELLKKEQLKIKFEEKLIGLIKVK